MFSYNSRVFYFCPYNTESRSPLKVGSADVFLRPRSLHLNFIKKTLFKIMFYVWLTSQL